MKIKILLYTLVSLMEVMVVAQTKSHPAMSTHATASQIHDRAENYNLINLACPGNVTVNNDAGQCQANVVLPDYDVSGNAIAFDGTNDYLSATLPTAFAAIGTTDFTVETWVNPSSHGTSRRVFFAQYDQSNFMTILINSSGVVYVFVQNNATVYSTNTQTVAPLNQWTHIAFRWVASTKAIQVLINGTLAPSISGGSSSLGTNNRMTIGSRSDGMQVFSGKIDEFRIWNTLRSNSEIVGSMTTCVPEASTGLIAYYRFDETSGSLTAADATGNGYDSTLNNMDSSTVWVNGITTCGASAVNDYTGTNNASGTYPIGNTTVNWTIDDGQGNISNCTQIVTVTDAEDPVITCPATITLNAAAGQCTATASIGTATATDNCGSPTVTNDAPTAFPLRTEQGTRQLVRNW
ncbi:LamG domain-containing protein [Flavobacterium sp. NRK F10]|uniref:LamG domain-containing protein n=1 Tax=Flavobacterium sp. NRK F10 TaxID=2954931 RepID=UPI0020917985|nr:LamG domain-containing protein [Flavobacterium sp. NRK F10]MCO6173610.1 LamG domain-containing protein [Flavobacterium sp. NRK F10]